MHAFQIHRRVLGLWGCYRDRRTLLIFIISQNVLNRHNPTEKVMRGRAFLGTGGVGQIKEVCVFVFLTVRARETLTRLAVCITNCKQAAHPCIRSLSPLPYGNTDTSKRYLSLSHFLSLSLREHSCAVAHSCIFHDYPLEFLWKTMSCSCHHSLALCARATH